ncbi:MAG TPA: D-glycero-beta-D-manno-heptose-7-phosphate kinase [Chthoniobacterales bacterium]|jgi:D-beta-D-heptose 7-phosphate kinase/D-beta-D-heptose 1-phosphate adenosyltransferase|nr:D-glycero-beta-D-manno-heptose-7-phosphate kinase [Chthoniobacterales bacterium]
MNTRRLKDILARAKTRRILVIGDLMLDEFVWGKVGRISPEAPVPVVEVTGESFYPGGAANVARNLRAFIKDVAVIGLLGTDRGGRQLRELMAQTKIDTRGAIEDPKFPTIVKTRIIARNQQVVRVDREQPRSPAPAQISRIVASVRRRLPRTDAVIFEDYGKGFLTADLVAQISAAALAAGKTVTGDPNPHHSIDWEKVTAVKPNRNEAFLAAGIAWSEPVEPASNDRALLRVGEALLKKWQTKLLLVTLGEHGMMLFERGTKPHHIPTRARQVFDVSGAGDTAIALFTLALSCGASAVEAAEIANHASAVVVGKLGTATVTPEELIASFQHDRLL